MHQSPRRSHTESKNNAFGLSGTTPFENAEEAWFWFMAANDAKNDGAKFVAGAGLYKRPCEPIDILKVLDRLHRNRRLHRDHLLVLRHYGRRHVAPDPFRAKEKRAHHLWSQALERIEETLVKKGIVTRNNAFSFPAFMRSESISRDGATQ